MRFLAYLSAISSVIGLPACTAYPLPQDTTGSRTEEIVQHVRCEARTGLRETALEALENPFAKLIVWKGLTGAQLATRLREKPREWKEIQIKDFVGEAKKDFEYYENSQIAYEFSLELQESNTDTAGLTLTRNFFGGRADSLGLGGTSYRTRKTMRVFNIVDTFSELAQDVDEAYCNRPASINLVYPLVGSLPIYDLVYSYIQTNQFHKLGGPGKDPKTVFGTKSSPAVPQMGDTIVFTTRFTGSLGATFSPTASVGAGFVPTSATLKTEDFREDQHQVLIVVSTSPEAATRRPLDPLAAPPLRSDRGALILARTRALPPAVNGKLTDPRFDYGLVTLQYQRQKNVDDAIVRIGDSLGRFAQ